MKRSSDLTEGTNKKRSFPKLFFLLALVAFSAIGMWQDSAILKDVGVGKEKGHTATINVDTPSIEHKLDAEKCRDAIKRATDPLLIKKAVPSMLSTERKSNIVQLMTEAVLSPELKGDWVETGTWMGGASLIAAYVQKVGMEEPACGSVRKRSIWLADSFEGLPPEADDETKKEGYSKNMDAAGSYAFEGGLDTVKSLFQKHGFEIDGTGDVPIQFIKGYFNNTLPDSPIEDIAVLRLDGDMYSSTLQALFALYRRLRVGGYVIVDDYGHWPQCQKAIDEFFVDANATLEFIDYTGRWFSKKNNNVRIPTSYRDSVGGFQYDPRVVKAWDTLNLWHKETVKNYVGHVGTNRFQTYRYIEAIRHTIQAKKKVSIDGEAVRVNVCETGFNGGHSAMLFMAFLNKEEGELVHYYGWDLKKIGSASPTADKMSETFGEYFHITWGDSKETLKGANNVLKGQLCDLVVVDGEHSANGVRSDLTNFLKVTRPGAVVFGDDCAPYKRTVPRAPDMKAAWNEFVERKEIISVANYRNPELPSPGFVEGLVPDKDGEYKLGI